MPENYEYDVFLSYSRSGEWPPWIRKHFLPIVTHLLTNELGEKPKIFVDYEDIDIGNDWPKKIERALATSKVMVALWSKPYFNREWCRRELSAMMAKADGLPGCESENLVHPLAIHDCIEERERPQVVHRLQMADIKRYCKASMTRNSATREKLERSLEPICERIASHIRAVPEGSAPWPLPDYESYFQQMVIEHKRQTEPPSLGLSS